MGDDGEKFFEKVTGKSRDNAGLVTLPFLRIPLGGCATGHLPPATCRLLTQNNQAHPFSQGNLAKCKVALLLCKSP